MQFETEVAGPADAEALAELHFISHTVSFAPFASPEWVASRSRSEHVAQWADFFSRAGADERMRAWKVRDAGAVVGMVKIHPVSDSEAHLSSMHVHPEYQRRRIGSLLMKAALQFIRATGFSTATLGVIQANAPARAMYERHGWKMRELHDDGVEGVPVAVYELDLKA